MHTLYMLSGFYTNTNGDAYGASERSITPIPLPTCYQSLYQYLSAFCMEWDMTYASLALSQLTALYAQ